MLIKEIPGMEFYLANNCYCPNEIYSSDGFFYQLFYAEDECELIGERDKTVVIVAKSRGENALPQIIQIFRSEDKTKILDTTRFDATENNLKIFKLLLSGMSVKDLVENKYRINEYKSGATAKALKDILSIADAIIID